MYQPIKKNRVVQFVAANFRNQYAFAHCRISTVSMLAPEWHLIHIKCLMFALQYSMKRCAYVSPRSRSWPAGCFTGLCNVV
jgi:hypothetical protein